MKKHIPVTLLLILLSVQGFTQKKEGTFLVVSYNVENLFDTVDAPQFRDEDFTPGGIKNWTWERYEKKLDDLSRVILSIPEKEMPAIIGLAEVENRKVVEDLAGNRGMKRAKYRIIHEEGLDPRGIECAMLYRPDLFRYRSHEYIPVDDPLDPEYLYRGILHVHGTGPDGSSLHIFMNHWKSRGGGLKKTEKQRMFTAISLRKQLDILLSKESDFRVILMGDFNDEPTNRSITSGLSASGKRRNINMGDHFNLLYDLHNLHGAGTYGYKGAWNMLDQVIVSYNLINQKRGLSTTFEGGSILKEEWMLYESEKYGGKFPSATYGGPEYFGGPSDHLPVYVVFTY
ncbi:MAG: endonuclease/exonuclease/phosphatase family protein [Bacteroidota bacterium]